MEKTPEQQQERKFGGEQNRSPEHCIGVNLLWLPVNEMVFKVRLRFERLPSQGENLNEQQICPIGVPRTRAGRLDYLE